MSGIIPYVDFIINTGKNPLTGNIVDGNGVEMDPLLLSFVGGFISGFGSALALRHGTSTGGIDILSQALSFKKNISITAPLCDDIKIVWLNSVILFFCINTIFQPNGI